MVMFENEQRKTRAVLFNFMHHNSGKCGEMGKGADCAETGGYLPFDGQ